MVIIYVIIAGVYWRCFVLCKTDNVLFDHGSMAELTVSKDQQVFLADIESMQWAWGSQESQGCIEYEKPLMSGRFTYHQFDDGLSVHAENAVEEQDSCNTFILQPGLSFTFMFVGCIDVSFAGQAVQLMAEPEQPCCYAIVNNASDVMSRKMCKGMYVKKLNIFVKRSWLERRNVSSDDALLLSQVFAEKKVCHWRLDKSLQGKIEHLMKMRNKQHYADKLELEYLVMQLLTSCIRELKARLASFPSVVPQHVSIKEEKSLKSIIDKAVSEGQSLTQIAAGIGMSERTIQRKFKQQYGETVSSFIKSKRMEKAKRALLVDGKTIGEAAYAAGYNHTSNFVSAFKKSIGITPSEYIQLHR